MLQDLKSRFRARLSNNSNSEQESTRKLCKYYLSSITGMAYVVTSLACIFMLVTLTSTLINCQKYPTTNCNQQQHSHPYLQQQQQLQVPRQQRQFNPRNGHLLQQPVAQKVNQHQQQQQHLAQLQLQHQQQIGEQAVKQTNEVEHEEFSLALGLSSNQQQANGNYTLLPASPSQDKAVSQASNNQSELSNLKDTSQAPQEITSPILNTTPAIPSDSIGSPVALQPPLTTTSSIPSSNVVADTKVPVAMSASASQSVPVTTASSATLPPTPPLPSTSTTTTASTVSSAPILDGFQNQTTNLPGAQAEDVNNNKNFPNKQPQTMQHSTRQAHQHVGHNEVETATAQARSILQDLEPARVNSDQYQTRHGSPSDYIFTNQVSNQAQFQIGQTSNRHPLMDSLPQPVSSSPSSISIITPLIGPPNQHQQQPVSHTTSVSASIGGPSLDSQQSAMMKPLFVVGNPITERDYNGNSLYYHQYQQPSKLDHSYSGQVQQPPQVHQGHHEPINKLASKTEVEHNQQQADALSAPNHNLAAALNKVPPKAPIENSVTTNSNQNNQQQAHAQQQQPATVSVSSDKQARIDKSAESSDMLSAGGIGNDIMSTINTTSNYSGIDRMSGPPLMYSDGQLNSVVSPSGQQVEQAASGSNLHQQQQQQQQHGIQNNSLFGLQPPSPRLFQGPSVGGAAVLGNSPRRPSLPPPVNQANAASGFRSPMSPSGPLVGTTTPQILQQTSSPQTNSLQQPVNSLIGNTASFYQNSPPYAGAANMMSPIGSVNSIYNNNNNIPAQSLTLGYNKNNFQQASPPQTSLVAPSQPQPQQAQTQQQTQQLQQLPSSQQLTLPQSSVIPTPSPGSLTGPGRRPLNITRVEHISAECSNDLIRAVIVFNGTFKGIIYSSGYVTDPTCLYVNGTGSTRYEFNIRLNQCGTLGRQELHQPTIPGEARRRDQVMWNTLSIQYNSIIEQEWDEHFRVSCEYGSDFWKTVSFSPFNVETNTGSPVVFTINPPQCQMDVLQGHGMGPKISVDGPVTVGDPLTLLIHMKSEKAGYDILVKNCVAHNGGKQRMQLIDSNGCVVNERFISPFRGTYNDNDLRHVTLYAYLKAFRFTGSPVLYLECEIHMCQSACPPQMCYWRRLSKRSVDEFDYEYTTNSSNIAKNEDNEHQQLPQQPVISDSLNLFKALQVRQESEPMRVRRQMRDIYAEDDKASLICYRHTEVMIFSATIGALFLLVITIAVTCWIRIRNLTRCQFQHNRLATTSSSLSPSLLSINDAISSASSIISGAANGSLLNGLSAKSCHQSPSWHFQHPHHHNQQQHSSYHLHHNHQQQKQPSKPTGLLIQRQPAENLLPVFHGRPSGFTPPGSR